MNRLKGKRLVISLLLLSSFSIPATAETIPQTKRDVAQILMLEKALAPQTPEALALLFAKANQSRNGAVQFMLFSPSLKNKYKESWPYWVSGVSSPWLTSYSIKKIKHSARSWEFQIHYQGATAAGPIPTALVQTIQVEPVPRELNASQTWWITQLKEE